MKFSMNGILSEGSVKKIIKNEMKQYYQSYPIPTSFDVRLTQEQNIRYEENKILLTMVKKLQEENRVLLTMVKKLQTMIKKLGKK